VRAPTAAELLDTWECALAQSTLHRALLLLGRACPEARPGELSALPIGERDRRLVELRRMLFGPRLSMVASCPACGARLESSSRIEDIWPRCETGFAGVRTCVTDGYRMTLRPLSSDDLIALGSGAQRDSARGALLGRCLTDVVDRDGKSVSAGALPAHVIAAAEAQMAAADPQADVRLQLACPECEHRWRIAFDIGSFLWQEIHAWAQRTLREVHALARSYGWRESDVLALSATRRQVYLELAGQ
jgi:hypothetical protein